MKVLYLGVYKDGTGWGNATINYILALDSVGVEVVPRAISLTPADEQVDVPERSLALEDNDETGCDVCIQHLLADMMEFDGRFDLNVGMFAYETSHFRHTVWAEHLNLMDQVWVFNNTMLQSAAHSFVFKPIHIVPHCFDLSKYSQPYDPYPIPETKNKFVFYTIGEVLRRKNLAGLLKAFHLEFSPEEPVEMLIKGNVVGASPMDSNRAIRSIIDEVKRGLRIYPKLSDYHEEIIITQWLDDEKMMRLHKTGHCFVLPSYGEAWGIPGFEAMALGNPVILTQEGGPADYVEDGKSGLLIHGKEEPVFIRPEEVPAPRIWTGDENWIAPDINHLRTLMRQVYKSAELRDTLGSNGIDRAYEYSYHKVGQTMKELLDGTITTPFYDGTATLREKHDLSGMVKGSD
jgi:glycosyltransferase involved in cell wall biosynthesis